MSLALRIDTITEGEEGKEWTDAQPHAASNHSEATYHVSATLANQPIALHTASNLRGTFPEYHLCPRNGVGGTQRRHIMVRRVAWFWDVAVTSRDGASRSNQMVFGFKLGEKVDKPWVVGDVLGLDLRRGACWRQSLPLASTHTDTITEREFH